MDFGALPPEVNSARMYSGPGSGPMLAAATGWDELAIEMGSAATSYAAVIARLTALSWYGPAATWMASAAAPYVTWMSTTATAAEQAADQARAAAAAYAAAFAATVPPPVIAANRSLLMTLIATNIFGQNTPAIAATEAQYAEMWAQDAVAMYGYAGSSAVASTLTPFAPPQQVINPSGLAAQGAAVAQATGGSVATDTQAVLTQLTSSLPTVLQGLASPLSSSSLTSTLSSLSPVLSVTSSTAWIASAGLSTGEKLKGLLPAALAPAVAEGLATGPLGSGLAGLAGFGGAGTTVSAGMGQAGLVGSLSVPQSWTATVPAKAAAALTGTNLGAAPAANSGVPSSMLGGLPLAGAGDRGVAGIVPDARFLERPPMVPRWSNLG
ncbi:PPE family protein [Mycobacterium kiyosense]|uniref:PPE family protein n=4 Tax=Mycobacterium kiyosense TaxID=2871094 RepID=A0AA37UZD6_9MYCO|nr:PPE family protein [Mycobacterium kiyosense]GLB85831.1 PPE family protein [Mycobacterium kiyosense]GLB92260.1 PPE family protein [Mycobacterium kiyosense]GLB98568.1 PPE family protein [Mycobacterium kiyosense]GLC04783.1 PPE family protein [Mycobacterium kiyosense]GLC10215.1 PPE family protein [Mycobacterium kiyosense]